MFTQRQRLAVGVLIFLSIPVATFGTQIVFDPTNFGQAVDQVADDVELVGQFRQEIQNQLAMIQNWGFTQLQGILQSMAVWQQVFGQAGSTYSSPDPGNAVDKQYPLDPNAYVGLSDSGFQSMQGGWDQEERSVLIENRTVQNDTYANLQPTADRIQAYVEHSNAASGDTAAMQAGNEELATLVAQLQTLQAQEITDARGEVERDAQEQAEEAYAERQRQAVRADWDNPPQATTPLVDAFPLADQ